MVPILFAARPNLRLALREADAATQAALTVYRANEAADVIVAWVAFLLVVLRQGRL